MPKFIVTTNSAHGEYDRIDIELAEVRIGNVRCRFMGEKVVIYNVQIFPEFQGNGYGRKIIAYLRSRFEVIIADRVRYSAREFWKRMGFQDCLDGNWEYRQLNRP